MLLQTSKSLVCVPRVTVRPWLLGRRILGAGVTQIPWSEVERGACRTASSLDNSLWGRWWGAPVTPLPIEGCEQGEGGLGATLLLKVARGEAIKRKTSRTIVRPVEGHLQRASYHKWLNSGDWHSCNLRSQNRKPRPKGSTSSALEVKM
jgi:hypothetical protein